MRLIKLILLLIGLSVWVQTASAELYKCKDASGKIIFTDQGCGTGQSQKQRYKEDSRSQEERDQESLSQEIRYWQKRIDGYASAERTDPDWIDNANKALDVLTGLTAEEFSDVKVEFKLLRSETDSITFKKKLIAIINQYRANRAIKRLDNQ